jgi:DNA repair protein SbcC/Rad50
MKIKYLRFKNLNSLVGEWEINFSVPEYQNEGIFAITGKTGAGKSTILDAICLALYGETPRLGKITKSTNEIMSRRTGECFSEVVFESNAGQFRCHFSQHRSRKSPNGELQSPNHEIVDDISGGVIESKLRDVQKAVVEKIGMDFEQFTRSILLAQGGFAKFLSATSHERAPILEQITGTEIYSIISQKVHERNRDESNKLSLLQAETNSILLLSDEEKELLKLELTEKEAEEKKLKKEIADTVKFIQWYSNIDVLENEISIIQKQQEKLLIDLSKFESERLKLRQALLAGELESEYAILSGKRKELTSETKAFNESKENLPKIKEALEKINKSFLVTQEKVNISKENLKNEQKIIKKVRELDSLLSTKQSGLSAIKEEIKNLKRKISDNEEQKKKLSRNIADLTAEIDRVRVYVDKNSMEANLAKDMSGLENLVSQYSESSKIITKLQKETKELKAQEKDLLEKISIEEKSINSYKEKQLIFKKKIEEQKVNLVHLLNGKLLREYRAEFTSLIKEKQYLNKIFSLEEERKKLSDNIACPLCGSKEHPYAQGNVPEISEIDLKVQNLESLIKKIEDIEQLQKQKEEENILITEQIAPAEKSLAEISTKKAELKISYEHKEKELVNKEKEFENISKILSDKLKKYQITDISPVAIFDVITKLKERVNTWERAQSKLADFDTKNNSMNAELKSLVDVYSTILESMQGKEYSLKSLQEECDSLFNDRQTLYADKNTDIEEQKLEKIILDEEALLSDKQKQLDKEKQLLAELSSKVATIEETILLHKKELGFLNSNFLLNLQTIGIVSEETFLSYIITKEVRLQLTQQAKILDDTKIDIDSRLKDRQEKLLIEKDKKLTDTSLLQLKEKASNLEKNSSQLSELIFSIKNKFVNDELARTNHQEKLKKLELQKIESERWSALHSLIGSADGKKFRNYAQGLTFEIMVSHSNRQLLSMTDRYILIRDEYQPLSLNVVDNYQAGEIRSTKNLSGGESFIISLALALGLSNMASKKVRVDSLFLDEGFGTLDEESLNIALDTISALHEQGKLIGVISHIPAMKERIVTQIQVFAKVGGVSLLRGPGVVAK